MSGDAVQSSRVLVVRSGALRDRVAAAIQGALLDAEVEVSPSYLSAMGWLTRERVDVVIGPVSAMTGMVGSTARALRRLAPGTRLVVVAEPGERAEAAAALSAGFDECVYEPADASTLLSALRLAGAAAMAGSVSLEAFAEVAPDAEPAELNALNAPTEPSEDGHDSRHEREHKHETKQRDDKPHEDKQNRDRKEDAAGRAALGPDLLGFDLDDAGAIDLDGAVGDVDLVEAVMRRDGTLVPLAMRLLREQSGVGDAQYTPAEPDDSDDCANPDDADDACDDAPDAPSDDATNDASGPRGNTPPARIDVAFGGQVYGRLSSVAGDRATLGPWAAWLARWVAMQRRQDELYKLALRDELTGLWNRRYFDRFLGRLLRHAGQGRQQVTLLVFDIDNFKQYNDNYGHPAGDEILRSTATLIQSLVREHDVVARIGGDEFAVVFWDKGEPRHLGSQHPDNVIGIAKRFQKAICEHRFPKLGEQAVGRLTVSGGLAGFPWDGRTPGELIQHADSMAIQSKRQGKNAICFGHGAAPNGNGNGNGGC